MRFHLTVSFCVTLVACGSSNQLSGDTGRRTADNRATRKSNDQQAAGTSSKPPKDHAAPPVEDDGNDEDVRVIPPETVSAAYLTCANFTSSAEPAPAAFGYHGCVATDASGNRLDIGGTKHAFALTDKAGNALNLQVVKPIDIDQDIVWLVPNDVLSRGIVESLDLSDNDGNITKLERKCHAKVNSVIQEAGC